MKFSTACVVFAAITAAATPVRANQLVSLTASTLGDTFSRLIKTLTNIKPVEKQNDDFVSQALNGIARELRQGLDSEIFQIGSGIHNTLVDVNLKMGLISGNATLIISQIEAVALTISTLQLSDARLDYNIKKNRIKKLCADTLAMTNVVVQLFDETKEMLEKGVSGPLEMLQLTIQLTSDDRLVRESANITRQQSIISNPSIKWLSSTDYNAVNTAKALKREGSVTIERIEKLIKSILDHTKWFEGACQTIRNNLGNYRTIISAIESKISGASGSITMIADEFDFLLDDSRNMSDNYLREGSEALVQLMSTLRAEAINTTRDHTGKVSSYDYAATNTYQSAPEDFSQSLFLEQPFKPSWLDKTPINRCIYIYKNRTTGCIFVNTFIYMKGQYIWLSNKFNEYEAIFKAYEKRWIDLTTEVLNVFKNTSLQVEAIKFVADLETKKVLWSDDIKKIRDLSVSLDSYAESLFSDANAKLNVTKSNDDTLNKDIMRVVDDNKKAAMNIILQIENDIFDINKQEADIRLSPLFQV